MRRIQRAKDKEQFVQELIGAENTCFTEIWRLLLFAATLGYKVQRKEPLRQFVAGKAIPENYFSNNCQAWPGVTYLLGLVETDDTRLLSANKDSEDERLRLFEEYANGGLSYLEEKLEGKSPTSDIVYEIALGVIDPQQPEAPDLDVQV